MSPTILQQPLLLKRTSLSSLGRFSFAKDSKLENVAVKDIGQLNRTNIPLNQLSPKSNQIHRPPSIMSRLHTCHPFCIEKEAIYTKPLGIMLQTQVMSSVIPLHSIPVSSATIECLKSHTLIQLPFVNY
jgi:hypothetical protein